MEAQEAAALAWHGKMWRRWGLSGLGQREKSLKVWLNEGSEHDREGNGKES